MKPPTPNEHPLHCKRHAGPEPGTDFQVVKNAGEANGLSDAKAYIGKYGKFDFQRNKGGGASQINTFYTEYVHASNFAVGVYMNGAGYDWKSTKFYGDIFAGIAGGHQEVSRGCI
jgi:hypothetical protein